MIYGLRQKEIALTKAWSNTNLTRISDGEGERERSLQWFAQQGVHIP